MTTSAAPQDFTLAADMTRSEWESMAIAFNQASERRVTEMRAKIGGRLAVGKAFR